MMCCVFSEDEDGVFRTTHHSTPLPTCPNLPTTHYYILASAKHKAKLDCSTENLISARHKNEKRENNNAKKAQKKCNFEWISQSTKE